MQKIKHMYFEYFDFDTHMVLMPFQVIRSPGFTYNSFQVILITLGLTFQNLAVDKTNNCTNPLIKTPGPIMSDDVIIWCPTSSKDIWCHWRSFRISEVWDTDRHFISGSEVCLTPIDLHLYIWYVSRKSFENPNIRKSITFHGLFLNPYFILFRCIF